MLPLVVLPELETPVMILNSCQPDIQALIASWPAAAAKLLSLSTETAVVAIQKKSSRNERKPLVKFLHTPF
jgi:hypothetical protein